MKRFTVGLVLSLALLSATASAQFRAITYDFTNIPTSQNGVCFPWVPVPNVLFEEQQEDNLWGDPGQGWSYYSLYLRLAKGFTFNRSIVAQGPNTQANLQQNITVTYLWYDYNNPPTPPSAGTLTASGNTNVIRLQLVVKNIHKIDQILVSNLQVQVLPGNGSVIPNDYLYWMAVHDGGSNRAPAPIITGVTENSWSIVQGQSGNVPVTAQSSVATSLMFIDQPNGSVQFDFESEPITTNDPDGVGPTVYPSVQLVDCAGYYTALRPTGADAFATITTNPSSTFFAGDDTPDFDVNGRATLNLTMQDVGLFTFTAALKNGLTTLFSTNSSGFTVAQRIVDITPVPTLEQDRVSDPGYFELLNNGGVEVRTGRGGAVMTAGINLYMSVVQGTSIPCLMLPTIGTYPNGIPTLVLPTAIGGTVSLSGVGFMSYQNPGPLTFTLYAAGPDGRYTTDDEELTTNALPVELVSFNAALRNDVVTLKWRTATEANNAGFEVERSFDRTMWQTLGFVQGQGTSNTPTDYAFSNRLSEKDRLASTISYRLKQIDRDGTTEYSPVVTVNLAPAAGSVTLLQNYPNPFNPSTTISFHLAEAGPVTLTVYNELGVEVARVHEAAQLDAGWHSTSFNASALPSGLYAYRLQTPAGVAVKTMMVTK